LSEESKKPIPEKEKLNTEKNGGYFVVPARVPV
jgi:hypothetical protein